MPEELKEQLPLLQEMLAAMGIATISLAGYEADDLLGTLAKRSEEKGMDVTVLSGDRDLLQLASKRNPDSYSKDSQGTDPYRELS